jgi:hypothetical protein
MPNRSYERSKLLAILLILGFIPPPESLLIVGPCPPDKYPNVVLPELDLELFERLDDSLEGGGHVGKVGDAAADDENLALCVLLLGHEREQRLGVVVRLHETRFDKLKNYTIFMK